LHRPAIQRHRRVATVAQLDVVVLGYLVGIDARVAALLAYLHDRLRERLLARIS
jgi:hypothetical protein